MNKIQTVILEIFKCVHSICEEEGLRYFAIGGTCIGAVRHNGFIPWDDDIDIAMPIEDYLQFVEICGEKLPECYELYTFEDHPTYGNIFMKVCDKRTTFIEEKEFGKPETYKGIWLDIMPLSGMPSEECIRRRFIRKAFFYDLWMTRTHQGFKFMESWKAKLVWIAAQPFNLLMRKDPRALWFDMLKNCSFDGSKYTGYVWWGRHLPDLVFPTAWFDDYELRPFENTKMRCPIGWHDYLTCQFGDYMQLPPENKRVFHLGYVDPDNSYQLYQTGELQIQDTDYLR